MKFSNAHEAVVYHPVVPARAIFVSTLASFSAGSPNRVDEHSAETGDVRGCAKISTDKVLEEIGRRRREVELVVDAGENTKNSVATTKNVEGGVVRVGTEATTNVHSVSARVGEKHIVRERYNVEPSVMRYPSGCGSVVVKKCGGIDREQTHSQTFLINVRAVLVVMVFRVEYGRVSFRSFSARFDSKRVVAARIDAGKSALRSDTHRPSLHRALGGAGTRFVDKRREISNIRVAQLRRDAKVLRTRKL